MSTKSYFIDDKFDVILAELQSLGPSWARTYDMRQAQTLLWTNLRNILWEDVMAADPGVVVNHLKGSQVRVRMCMCCRSIRTSCVLRPTYAL